MSRIVVAGVLGALAWCVCAPVASASSPDAWAEWRASVAAKCRAAAARDHMSKVRVQVDPGGSESYGFALVKGLAGKAAITRLCVVPKTIRDDGQAELSNETSSFLSR